MLHKCYTTSTGVFRLDASLLGDLPVTDNTDFSVEWYGETRTPASILCSELAEMEGVTQGFIYASDDICTEADLAEVEALINDETLLHVYLKPCGGEEFGVLMEKSPVVRAMSLS